MHLGGAYLIYLGVANLISSGRYIYFLGVVFLIYLGVANLISSGRYTYFLGGVYLIFLGVANLHPFWEVPTSWVYLIYLEVERSWEVYLLPWRCLLDLLGKLPISFWEVPTSWRCLLDLVGLQDPWRFLLPGRCLLDLLGSCQSHLSLEVPT